MSKKDNAGFTLIEMMISLAIIMAIVSMVYGSYAATTRSMEVSRRHMASAQRAELALRFVSRQIRSAYAPPSRSRPPDPALHDEARPAPPVTSAPAGHADRLRPGKATLLFRGDSRHPRGEILSFVSTSAFGAGLNTPGGLSRITYRHDRAASTLSLTTEPATDPFRDVPASRPGQTLLQNVTSVELAFHDAQRWHDTWDSTEKHRLPEAVKITLVLADETGRQRHFATAVPIMCDTSCEQKSTK